MSEQEIQTKEQMCNELDLFDNPMVRAARAAMSQDQLDKYKEIGEALYSIDFENCTVDTDFDSLLTDAVQYIEMTLKSGLHPSMLSDDDKNVLKEVFGEKWYEKYGYVEKDLTEIYTFKF